MEYSLLNRALFFAAGVVVSSSAVHAQCTPPKSLDPTGNISASADITRATTKEDKLSVSAKSVVWLGDSLCPNSATRRYRVLLSAGSDYKRRLSAKENSIIRSHRFDASVLRQFQRHMYVDGVSQLYHNNQLGVRLQQVFRASVGAMINGFELGAGPAYVRQDFGTAGVSGSFSAVSMHETATLALGRVPGGEIRINESIRALIPANQANAEQLTATAQATIPLLKQLGITWTVWNDYIRNAPKGREKRYLTTSIGLNFDF